MAVYVDDMYTIPLGNFGRMKMSHLVADTKEELLQMVDKIGVNRKWIQSEDTPYEHFDICVAKRKLAIANGTIDSTMKEVSVIITKKKSLKNGNT